MLTVAEKIKRHEAVVFGQVPKGVSTHAAISNPCQAGGSDPQDHYTGKKQSHVGKTTMPLAYSALHELHACSIACTACCFVSLQSRLKDTSHVYKLYSNSRTCGRKLVHIQYTSRALCGVPGFGAMSNI